MDEVNDHGKNHSEEPEERQRLGEAHNRSETNCKSAVAGDADVTTF